MTDQFVPALRRGLLPKAQTMYLRAMWELTRLLGHSPDTAAPGVPA